MDAAAAGPGLFPASRRRLVPGRLALAALAAAALVALPVAALVWSALSREALEVWPNLVANVLPPALADTLLLLAGTGLVAGTIGVGTAWLVTQYDFPGRRSLEWLLVLPLAIPTYITAYVYVDALGFQGPVQGALRWLFGFRSLRDYWFPEVRSLGGAVLLMSLVLFPYVYLSVRALFSLQSACALESARTLGAAPGRLFWRIGLPMARPAIAAGLTLVMLEALNDLGASEYLGIRTLTLSITTTWLNRGSLAGAAQIACVMLLVVLGFVLLEQRMRGQRRFALSVRRPRAVGRARLAGLPSFAATTACALPVLLGAAVPILMLAREVLKRSFESQVTPLLLRHLGTTLLLAGVASLCVVGLGLCVAAASRQGRERWLPGAVRIASLGYALPGTVLALGLIVPLAAFDNAVAEAVRSLLGVSPGLLLIGSGAALVIAYVVRFLSIAIAGVQCGLARVSDRIDDAARCLGADAGEVVRKVHWPLSRQAIAAAGLLVFVDCMKELPATLLLRPLNVETLATLIYGQAARGSYEDGALAALLIVLAGLYPAVRMARIATPGAPGP